MNEIPDSHASTRTVHTRNTAPRTWRGLALYVGFVALIPLTLFALEHPLVVTAGVTGTGVGLLARPVLRRLARRPDRHQSNGAERPSNALGHSATND